MTKGIFFGLENRNEVLLNSLSLELMTSGFLSSLLGIKNFRNSLTLGNNGTALSFNQKINLLIDMGALSTKNRRKFQCFMEIRNQFMHNFSACSYEKCFDNLNGNDTFILRNYPERKQKS